MSKTIMPVIFCLVLAIIAVPFSARAAGGYVASKSSEVYHTVDCHHVERINRDNQVSFRTMAEAEKSGRRPCDSCMPNAKGTDFYYGKTSASSSSDPVIQAQLENEYRAGYQSGSRDAAEAAAAEKAKLERQHAAEKWTVGGIGAAAVAATAAVAGVKQKRMKQSSRKQEAKENEV